MSVLCCVDLTCVTKPVQGWATATAVIGFKWKPITIVHTFLKTLQSSSILIILNTLSHTHTHTHTYTHTHTHTHTHIHTHTHTHTHTHIHTHTYTHIHTHTHAHTYTHTHIHTHTYTQPWINVASLTQYHSSPLSLSITILS